MPKVDPGFVVVAVILLLQIYLDYRRDKIVSAGLTGLQAAVDDLTAKTTDLATKVTAVDADVKKLIAGSSAGPGPGQVIVNQTDLDKLASSVSAASSAVSAATGTLAADDAAANPAPNPTPAP